MRTYTDIAVRAATRAELRFYRSQVTSSLIVAEDENGAILGWCEYQNDHILAIESFVYQHGIGRALVSALPHVTIAESVQLFAYPFWTAMGFEPIEHSRDWQRKDQQNADPI